MSHQCDAFSWTDRNTKAGVKQISTTADLSVPKLRSKAPTHHQVFWLMQPGTDHKNPRPARLPAFSWGSAPQWPPFGAKPRSCKYSYGKSPGFPPGSFYPPATHRSGKGEDDTVYFDLYYFYTIFLYDCQYFFQKERKPLRCQTQKGGGGWFCPDPCFKGNKID